MRNDNEIIVRYGLTLVTAALAGIGGTGCGALDEATASDPIAQSTALLGATTYSACNAADVPHLDVAIRFAHAAGNAPAFAECIANSFNAHTHGGGLVPSGPNGEQLNIGPYMACSTDPKNTTASSIAALLKSYNPTKITCDYTLLNTSTAGWAQLVDEGNSSTTPEVMTLGSALAAIQGKTSPCYARPADPTCMLDNDYSAVASVIAHEAMHQHGYNHFEYGSPNNLCGIDPAKNPQYDNGVPYMVGQCLFGVLSVSEKYCPGMATKCGDGLLLVNSTFAATPTCSCVQPPTGSVTPPPFPLPPDISDIPTDCLASTKGCGNGVSLVCNGGAREVPLEVKVLSDSSVTPRFIPAPLANPSTTGGYFVFSDDTSVSKAQYQLCLANDVTRCGQTYTVSFAAADHGACGTPGAPSGGGAGDPGTGSGQVCYSHYHPVPCRHNID